MAECLRELLLSLYYWVESRGSRHSDRFCRGLRVIRVPVGTEESLLIIFSVIMGVCFVEPKKGKDRQK